MVYTQNLSSKFYVLNDNLNDLLVLTFDYSLSFFFIFQTFIDYSLSTISVHHGPPTFQMICTLYLLHVGYILLATGLKM